jgi:tetratricopeptide (TPR) repeat protein
MFITGAWAIQIAGQRNKATPEITAQLKKAYAYSCQGQHEQTLAAVLPIYQKDPRVWIAWFPTWVYRVGKGTVPNPYDKSAAIRMTFKSYEAGQPFNLSAYRKVASVAELTARAYFSLGRYEEALKIYEQYESLRGPIEVASRADTCRRLMAEGYRPPQPSAKSTWKSLTVRFKEEDYFVMVSLVFFQGRFDR